MKNERRKDVARKHRAAVAARKSALAAKMAADQLSAANERADRANAKAARAFNDAFNRFCRDSDRLSHILGHMESELVRGYGPKIADEAMKLVRMSSQRERSLPVLYDASDVANVELRVDRIRIEIPAMRIEQDIARL